MIKGMRVVLLAVAFLVGISATGSSDVYRHITLRGVSAFSVVVEGLEPDLERAGVTQKRLQTAVEWRLLKAGLPVRDGRIFPYLYVNITALLHEDRTASASIRVEFKQEVHVLEGPYKDNPMVNIMATTWDSGGIVRYNLQQPEVLVDHIGAFVDKFVRDFLAENPRR